jgi:hypothetical protein
VSQHKEEVLKLWGAGKSPGRIHKNTGIPIQTIVRIIHDSQHVAADGEGYGRKNLQKYIIARRSVRGQWPQESLAALKSAQRQYDAGEIEMCQGRDGDIIIQYAIPRQVPCAQRNYFAPVL